MSSSSRQLEGGLPFCGIKWNNQQVTNNRRFKLVPRNAGTPLGPFILVVALQGGSVNGQIFHCACQFAMF